jgi:hypothetical protein
MNIDNQLAVLEKYGLTPNEFFVLELLLMVQDDYSIEYFNRYARLNEFVLRNSIESLQEKGVILKSYKISKDSINPYEIPINKNVSKTFWRASLEMGGELFEAYPMFGNINGNLVSLRSVSKRFATLEDAFRYYGKVINWNPDKHEEILDLIRWEQDNCVRFINMSLSSFIIDQKWNELKALRDGELANINYDTIRSL